MSSRTRVAVGAMNSSASRDDDSPRGKTEWEDALIKHGIMAAPERRETDDEYQLRHQQRMADVDPLAAKSLEQLDELEDDLDSDVIEKYRCARARRCVAFICAIRSRWDIS
jgi:hypothetical protein